MEPMITFRQHPHFLPFLELAQANRAFRRRNLHPGPVHRHRNLAQSALLEPGRRSPVRVRGEPPTAAHGAAHDRVEPQRSYERAEQGCQDDHHVGVEVGFVHVRLIVGLVHGAARFRSVEKEPVMMAKRNRILHSQLAEGSRDFKRGLSLMTQNSKVAAEKPKGSWKSAGQCLLSDSIMAKDEGWAV